MKNLFAIPRLPLFEAFTILITLAVCLAGFTEAEIHTKYRRGDSNGQEDENFLTKESSYSKNDPYTQRTFNMKDNELQQNHFAYFKSIPESRLDKLIKRHSDYFGESDESDGERENDGYGYDDDEYYHFNNKRNDEVSRNAENSNKGEKEGIGEANQKGVYGQKAYAKNTNTNEKEMKTIEMLNFKEFHPNVGGENSQNPLQNQKPYTMNDMAHKKSSSSDTRSSLNVIDLKENSALDDVMKDRKEESGGVLASPSADSKLAEAKKGVKSDEKESSKIKDSKLTDETEKKDKEASLKEGKEVVAAKNLKETSKSTEDKDKSVKLSESAKLEENIEKLNLKSKEGETAKIAKEEKDMPKFSEKVTADAINPKEISQINNRASFVSNDYKDNLDGIKTPDTQGEEKSSEEMNENEKNIGLTDYQQDYRENQRQYKGKEYNLKKSESDENFEFLNGQYDVAKVAQEQGKASPYYTVPVSFEYQNDNPNEFYNKRESWKNPGSLAEKVPPRPQTSLSQEPSLHIQPEQGAQQQQPQFDMPYENQKNTYPINFPASDLENTDYRKNYLKYLKRYKTQNENAKNMNPEPPSSGYQLGGKNSFRSKTENKKRKRSKLKKRRSMLSEEMSQEEKKAQTDFSNMRRSKMSDSFLRQEEKCPVEPQDSQSLSTKPTKQDTKLSDGKKYEELLDSSRLKRKSPQKFEYEIKVINQNQNDPKNVQLSRYSSMRLKKNAKAKILADSKYLKKYPYSQVSRDDLMRLNKKTESENEKKYKRRASLWKYRDQKSAIRTRAAPSGYYSNRVKFGQKNYARNNEKTNSEPTSPTEMNRMSPPYLNQAPSAADKTNQRSWEPKQQTFKHDPMKRFDENALLSESNSLFLVKKGERTAKAFEDGTVNKVDDEFDPDQLARILSKANDYVVLKKTDNNKFRKISDHDTFLSKPLDYSSSSYYSKNSHSAQNSQENLRGSGKQISLKNRNLRSRSPNSEKEDKKISPNFRNSNSKLNLKKTFDKFRDLADFFKENEQESSDGQNSPQEVKEGRDIVFSEDKLPDPIVITTDGSEKNEGLKQKPLNSIYSISTNFKNIDQPDRKNDVPNTESSKNLFTSEVKAENTELSWEPALKNVFPEAKTINSMNKNGNEIIVLDFNRNQLKTDHALHQAPKTPKGQLFNSLGSTPHGNNGSPLNTLGDRKVQVILGDAAPPFQFQVSEKNKNEEKRPVSNSQRSYSMMTNSLSDIPNLLKRLSEKQQNDLSFSEKSVKKKSEEEDSQNEMSKNYNQFLKDLGKLSEMDKTGYIKNNFQDLNNKRSVSEIILPPSSFSELSSYSDNSIRKLGSLLQNIITKDSPVTTGYDSNNKGVCKDAEEYERTDLYQNNGEYEADSGLKRKGQWFSSDEKTQDKVENLSKEERDEINNILQNEEMNTDKEKNYEELWEEIAEASDKVHRLRREGVENGELKKTIEDALSFRGQHDSVQMTGSSNPRTQEKSAKLNADLNALNSRNIEFAAEHRKNEKDLESQLKNNERSEDNSKEEKSLKPNYDSHLSGFFENLNKNPKNPSESAWSRKKRKNTHRQKRFSRRDNEDKVSKTEVQNTILKNLAEDNYQSVYSPGIKRKLLSTDNEAENDDGYSDADERDIKIAEEAQGKCVKNAINKCVDPLILELFGTDGLEEEKSRTRRSLTSSFHSNFKREIDLDESMPNDFQNFLVTSLGGFGSQKREVVKKDEPFWEGKESSQDNYNQIAESSPGSKEGYEDSALEKREVSLSESRNGKSFKNSAFYRTDDDADPTFANVMNSLNHPQKQTRSDEKSKLKAKATDFPDDKLPTQIRIQITNASSKEKKSSKPIMDENETTSTEMENLPKEKEFFDKNKINPLLSNNIPKLHQSPKNKISYNDFEEGENRDLSSKQKAYRTYRRRKRKKKKYVPENPMKPVKDFIAFDQKAMESLLRRYHANQNMMSDQTTQKSPVSNHLPQVETVYNPTQGTNKAQLETTRLGKINAISNKNAENSKNGLQSNDASAYDEGIIRSFLKAEKMKSDKGELKDFEDVEWKPFSGRMGLGRDSPRESQYGLVMPDQKTPAPSPVPFSTKTGSPRYLSLPYSQNVYNQKLFQTPYNNFYLRPPSLNYFNSQSLYDAFKLKQELKSRNVLAKDPITGKIFVKPYFSSSNDGSLYKIEDKDKQDNQFPLYMPPAEGNWNNFDYNKKPLLPKFQPKDYYPLSPRIQPQPEPRPKSIFLEGRKYKKLDFEKPLDSSHTDYLDTLESDYLDEDGTKDPQNNESVLRDASKKPTVRKLHETPTYYRQYVYKNSDADDNEDDEEIDEDYEENADDEELDDYSLLTNAKTVDPDVIKSSHGTEKLRNVYSDDDIFDQYSYFYPQIRGSNFDLTKFISNPEKKFDQGFVVADARNDLGPITESTSLLRKANENSNLFGKNLMKNLNRLSSDNAWNFKDKVQDDKSFEDLRPMMRSKLHKRTYDWRGKFKRRPELPKIGSRLYYAAKTEINDDRDISPTLNIEARQSKSSRPMSNRYSRGNPFSAEFVGVENCFETEPGENQKHINGNLMVLEKNRNSLNKISNRKDSLKDEYSNLNDIKENLEANGDTVSQDNFLENIIGRYIMRKRVKSSTDMKKNLMKTRNHEEKSDDSAMHQIKRRSTEKEIFAEKSPKSLRKRLSSGHLTENNFRKFHKKNINKKRHINDLVSNIYTIPADEQNTSGKDKKRENGSETKRSAFDLFKKITNKDRDNKKVENTDGRTAGFEPLLSLSDKKCDSLVKDTKDPLLLQDKKIQNDSPQSEIKSPLPELKAHYPNEGQQYLKAQLNERKKEKSKESVKEYPTLEAQGPWKVELNDKYDFKAAERPEKELRKNFKNVRVIETKPLSDERENLKAFLVISKNVKAAKRNSEEGLFPAFGSFLREVGNSYRPKSDEGRGISKKHVRKRSLESSNTRMTSKAEDAAKTPGDQITKEPNTENDVNLKEKNRALHDTESLSEGDSDPRAPHVLQRNSIKRKGFVTADDHFENSRFLSHERLNNRKSVFPPSSDANIIRDSRHINEETSEYLGHQIVDAILSHVSANPKFKEVIAPGLVMRAASNKENTDFNKKRALHQLEFSEQFQTFLKKFMIDLEKLAETHVKKRMCHHIDRQSKQFLQSLLNVSVENSRKKKLPKVERISSVSHIHPEAENSKGTVPPSFMDGSESVNSSHSNTSCNIKKRIIDNLRMKQCLLLKLLSDYQNLSEVEKGALDENYRFLLQELQQTNRALKTQNTKPHVIKFTDTYNKINCEMELINNSENEGFEAMQKQQKKMSESEVFGKNFIPYPNYNTFLKAKNNETNTRNANKKNNSGNERSKSYDIKESNKSNGSNEGNDSEKHNSNQPTTQSPYVCPSCATTKKPEKTKMQKLPVLYFSEMKNPNSDNQTVPKVSSFEKVQSVNSTNNNETDNENSTKKSNVTQEKNTDYMDKQLSVPTPQSFDLLPPQNMTTAIPLKIDQPATGSEYDFKDEKKTDNNKFDNYFYQSYDKPTALHKLSMGDAAGLQLSLKNRGPWVSTLDVAKTLRVIPNIILPSTPLPQPNAGTKETHHSQGKAEILKENSLKKNFRNPRSLSEVSNEYSIETGFGPQSYWNDKVGYSYSNPIFSYSVNNKFYTPKRRSFENAINCKWPLKNCQICPLQYLLRKYPPSFIKKVCNTTEDPVELLRETKFLRKYFGMKRKKRVPHFLIHHPKGFVKKHKKSKGLNNRENPNLL